MQFLLSERAVTIFFMLKHVKKVDFMKPIETIFYKQHI